MANTKNAKQPPPDHRGPWTIQREILTLKTMRVETYHEEYEATEFEFYVPSVVWTHCDVIEFRDRLAELPNGATVIKSVDGLWQDQSEETNIFRVIVRRGQVKLESLRNWAQNEVSRLTARLSQSEDSKQECVMFTEKNVKVSMCYLDPPKTKALTDVAKKPSSRVRRVQNG